MDLWYFFGYQGIRFAKENGLVGFIAPNNWITNTGASLFRNFVLDNAKIVTYTDFGNYKVFETASIQTMIYIMQKTQMNEPYSVEYSRLNNDRAELPEVLDFLAGNSEENITRFKAEIVKDACKDKYILFLNNKIFAVLNHIKRNSSAGLTESEIAQGIVAPQDFCSKASALTLGNRNLQGTGIFNLSMDEYTTLNLSPEEKELVKPFYTSTELHKYYGNENNTLWVIYTPSKFKNKSEMKTYPKLKAHLDKFVQVITSDNKPYGLHRARDEKFFKGEKIVSLRKTAEPCFTYTDFDCYVSQSYNVIKTERFNLKFLTAILNSNVIKFWLRYKGKMQGDNFQVDKEPLLELPLIVPTESEQAHLSVLADQMITAQEQLNSAISDSDKKFLQQRVDILDEQINTVVYGLYGLTADEVKIIGN